MRVYFHLGVCGGGEIEMEMEMEMEIEGGRGDWPIGFIPVFLGWGWV